MYVLICRQCFIKRNHATKLSFQLQSKWNKNTSNMLGQNHSNQELVILKCPWEELCHCRGFTEFNRVQRKYRWKYSSKYRSKYSYSDTVINTVTLNTVNVWYRSSTVPFDTVQQEYSYRTVALNTVWCQYSSHTVPFDTVLQEYRCVPYRTIHTFLEL